VSAVDPVFIIVADTSILINLTHTGHVCLLGKLPGFRFVVPDEVIAEISRPEQAVLIEEALRSGVIQRESIASPDELAVFADLTQVLGPGESACLALAETRGWLVACDEKRVFLREAKERIGLNRLVNTPGIYVLCIRAGLVTVEEADQAKATLESHRYRMAFDSFRSLV
jgi:predicted nucleic acid-binding protein